MAQGISLHIGLNHVDPAAYNGWSGQLSGCEADANSMKSIADGCGYQSSLLLNEQATSTAVIDAIGKAAQQLNEGDYFLITYSGHGGQVDDTNGDEDDGKDETWVLYDRMVIDDELYSLWTQFAKGVRIFMLSDSCHSGTVARDMKFLYDAVHEMQRQRNRDLPQAGPRFKAIPLETSRFVEARDAPLYRTLQWVAGNSPTRDLPLEASLILISACQDNQVAQDGDSNGLFTQNLLQVWNNGAFDGTYPSFHAAIKAQMDATQTPNYFKLGPSNPDFECHHPFDIMGGMSVQPSASNGSGDTAASSTDTSSASDTSTPDASASSSDAGSDASTDTSGSDTSSDTTRTQPKPAVQGPATLSRARRPSFQVSSAGNPYFVFEIANDPKLLENPPDPNDSRYYGSWNDPKAPARLTGNRYDLPQAAWDLVKGNSRLYYRIATTRSMTGWDGYQVSDVRVLSVTAATARDLPTAPPMRPRTFTGQHLR